MSVNVPLLGFPKPIILDLTTTAVTPIYTGGAKLRGLLNSLFVCNDSGGAATFTLTLTDAVGTVVKLYNLKSVASNDTFPMPTPEILIPSGWELAIAATSANTLHVVATIVEIASTK